MIEPPVFYFGGKRDLAPTVWQRFGKSKVYIEPFTGMAASLLGRPIETFPSGFIESVNDKNALIANFFRSAQCKPEEVVHHAVHPPIEIELLARWSSLLAARHQLSEKLLDPEYYDARAGGWWLYCFANFVRPREGAAKPRKMKPSFRASGILSPNSQHRAWDYFVELQQRMANVRIMCRDYQELLVDSEINEAKGNVASILVDPPYKANAEMYAKEFRTTPFDYDALLQRCIELGSRDNVRIALCGYSGDYDMPDDWTIERWHPQEDSLERVWYSPGCKDADMDSFWENKAFVGNVFEQMEARFRPTPIEGLIDIIRGEDDEDDDE